MFELKMQISWCKLGIAKRFKLSASPVLKIPAVTNACDATNRHHFFISLLCFKLLSDALVTYILLFNFPRDILINDK